jgi:DNA-binding MarR family transcriptional regulator
VISPNPHPTPHPTPSQGLVDAVDRFIRVSVGLTTVALEDHGSGPDLTLHQWRALVLTAEAGEVGLRVGEIARRLGIALPGASRLVARLEGRGLVLPERDPSDRRATIVRPTAAGTVLWEAVRMRRRTLIADVIATLALGPDDPAVDVLDRLAGGLAAFS